VDGRTIARRLGGPVARRRRHRRVGALLLVLAVVGAVLVALGSGSDDPDADERVAAACRRSNEELATAQSALLRDNESPLAPELFLGDAFVDLMRQRADAIRALDPPPSDDVLALLEEHDRVVDAVEADPAAYVFEDPFADLDPRWAEVGLGDCVVIAGTVGP
jgi:hypothetical protein